MKSIAPMTNRESTLKVNRRELERVLVAAAQSGSRPAFEQLYQLYAKSVFRVAYSITRNREDAEDAAQDAFFKAYLALGQFRQEAMFHSWLVRITMNSSLMLLRKRRLSRELSMDGTDGSDEAHASLDVPDPGPDPEQTYRQKLGCLQVIGAIKRLPQRLRAVAELRILHEHSIDETGKILGISDAAIKSRLHRARAHLAAGHMARPLSRQIPIEV